MTDLTLVVALGDEDRDRVGTVAEAVRKVVGGREAAVLVGHVLTESDYENAVETLSERVDRSPEAVAAGRPETTALHITPGSQSTSSDLERDQAALSPGEAARRIISQKAVVREMVDALDEVGLDSEVRGAIGDPAPEIVAIVEDDDADFVVVGGRGRSQTRQAVFGSVSQEILRTAPCPVVSIREAATE